MRTRLLCATASSIVAVGALAGCAQSPEVAATVGSHTISTSDVDLMARALCADRAGQAASTGQVATDTFADSRREALSALIKSWVDQQLAARHHLRYDAQQLDSSMTAVEPTIDRLPASDRGRARTLIADQLRGQLQVDGAAIRLLRQSGQKPTQQLLQQTVDGIESTYARNLKARVNPDLAGASNSTGVGGGSVSVPVSKLARSAMNTSGAPDPSYVASLPAAQRCG